jgi:hypothetical protein
MKNIVDIIPGKYDMISGSAVGALLQGTGIMKNVNVLILGERHSRNIPCFEPCTDKYKCVETIEIPNVLVKHLPRRIIDLYVELEYYGKNKTKNDFSYTKSRMNDYGKLNKKGNSRMRVHYVDIRNINIKNKVSILKISWGIDAMMHVAINDISEYDEEESLYFKNSILKFKEILDKKFKLIIDIFDSDKSIEYRTKIKRQRDRALLSNKKINHIIDKIDNYFRNANEKLIPGAKKYIAWVRSLLKNVTNDQTLQEIKDKIIYNESRYTNMSDYETDFEGFNANYMDRYTIYRMFRVFDNKEQRSIVFYGGAYHSTDIYNCLMSTGVFKIVFNRGIKDNDEYQYDKYDSKNIPEDDCIRIKKL